MYKTFGISHTQNVGKRMANFEGKSLILEHLAMNAKSLLLTSSTCARPAALSATLGVGAI